MSHTTHLHAPHGHAHGLGEPVAEALCRAVEWGPRIEFSVMVEDFHVFETLF